MNRRETGTIMDILRAAYPRFYAKQDELVNALNIWADMFRDDDVRIVAAAVKALISTDEDGYPPHIGAVKAKIRQITRPDEMTEMEAWDEVRKALKNSTYGSVEEYNKLPPVIQRVVGSPEQLKLWASMDEETTNSVIASNFQRSYKAKAASEREYQALPQDVRDFMSQIASGMDINRLEEGKKEASRKMEIARELLGG